MAAVSFPSVLPEMASGAASPGSVVASSTEISAAVCVTGQLRGVCTPQHTWPLLHHILPTLAGQGRTDLFLVVPEGSDCERAAALFPNATELLCVADGPLSRSEQNWVTHGPEICWNRERYLLQLRLVCRCGELVRQRMLKGAAYRWIMRARADVFWERFSLGLQELEEAGDVVQLAYHPIAQWQAFADGFALGPAWLMLQYLAQYDFVLDPRNWRDYDMPQGDNVWRRQWAHKCNYPELILERYLFLRQVPARYTRHVCFNRMRSCGVPSEAACGSHLSLHTAVNGSVLDDMAPFREKVLEGYEVLPEHTFPAHYQHDAILAAKLVEFLHREHRRLARPPKVVDLGCGRGTLVQEFRIWGLLTVGLDKNPLLTSVIPEVGIVEDVTSNLSFTIKVQHQRCNYEAHIGYYSEGMDFESADQTGRRPAMTPMEVSSDDPMNWVSWLLYLMGRCCLMLACKAFGTNGRLKYGVPPKHSWRSSDHVWMYVKKAEIAVHSNADATVENQPGPGVLKPISVTGGVQQPGMDWVVSLDVGQNLPSHKLEGFFSSIQNLAKEGAILSWGRSASQAEVAEVTTSMVQHGFRRDAELEDELRLFAGVNCCRHFATSLLAFRRIQTLWPLACEEWFRTMPVHQHSSSESCVMGVTIGCLDQQHIWIRGSCGIQLLELGNDSIKIINRTICQSATGEHWEYEECEVPLWAQISTRRFRGRAEVHAGRNFGRSNSGFFQQIHAGTIANLFASADPLSRPGELVWALVQEPAELVLVSKLVRLLAAPIDQFREELARPWESECRFLLISRAWAAAPWALEQRRFSDQKVSSAGWLPDLLLHVAQRAHSVLQSTNNGQMVKKGSGPLAAAAALLRRVDPWSYRRSSGPNAMVGVLRAEVLLTRTWHAWQIDGSRGLHSSAARGLSLRRLLFEGRDLWSVLAKRARRRPGALYLPLQVHHSDAGRVTLVPVAARDEAGRAAARYFHRLAAMPPD